MMVWMRVMEVEKGTSSRSWIREVKPAGCPAVLLEVGYQRKIFKNMEVSKVLKENESKKKNEDVVH